MLRVLLSNANRCFLSRDLVDELAMEVLVTSVRPAYRNTQNATIVLPQKQAVKLCQHRRVLIGWHTCRVELQQKVDRCYRFWEPGHKTVECRGPDRSKRCYNCGAEGHFRAACKESGRCAAYGKEGQRMGSLLCSRTDRQ